MPPISWTSKGRMPRAPDGGFADDGEGLFEQLVENGGPGGLEVLLVDPLESLGDAFAELVGLGAQGLVGERLHRRLERVDALHARQSFLMSRSCWVPKTLARRRSIIFGR